MKGHLAKHSKPAKREIETEPGPEQAAGFIYPLFTTVRRECPCPLGVLVDSFHDREATNLRWLHKTLYDFFQFPRLSY
jgi:hypothetical protein